MKKVLILNPIMYTPEGGKRKQESIKDTLLVTVCLGFIELGYQPTLIADEYYKPLIDETYSFEIIFLKHKYEKVFSPYKIPYPIGLREYLKNHQNEFEFVISSEVFSLYSYIAASVCKNKLIIWHEMAIHNRMMHGLVSKFWYKIVARRQFKDVLIAPRSNKSQSFIKHYCNNVNNGIFQHPIDVNKFVFTRDKGNYFISISQLVERKRVDKIISVFEDFSKDSDYKLIICGDGDQREFLKKNVLQKRLQDIVVFKGQVQHRELSTLLQNAAGLLVYTSKDNSILTISESIACGTPVLTTGIPDNAHYVSQSECGIVKDDWNSDDMKTLVERQDYYVCCCEKAREKLTNTYLANQFIELSKDLKESN